MTKDLAGNLCRLPQQVQMPGSVEQGAPTGNEGETPPDATSVGAQGRDTANNRTRGVPST